MKIEYYFLIEITEITISRINFITTFGNLIKSRNRTRPGEYL